MITVYSANCDDFSTNGLCVLTPTSCTVTETLNGQYELTMVHPLDEYGKWGYLQVGNILRAPVPANTTPAVSTTIQGSTGETVQREIWKVQSQTNLMNIRTGCAEKYKRIGFYRNGKEVEVLAKNVDGTHWFEIVGPDGKHGFCSSNLLRYVRTETVSTSKPVVTTSVIEGRQLRDQPFRIYNTEPTLTGITVHARHIFYDLMDNMVLKYKPSGSVAGKAAAKAMLAECSTAHDFTVLSDVTKTASGLDYEGKNPVEILLGSEGLAEKYGAEIVRDWYDVFFMNEIGRRTAITIRYARDLTGINCKTDSSGVVTRIIPQGQDKQGNPIYLPQKYVDSPNIGNYPHPRYSLLSVSDAKVDDKTTLAQAQQKMLSEAQKAISDGCDLPSVSLQVDFVNIGDTEEYRDYQQLRTLFLGDTAQVICEKIGVTATLRMTQYEYDCLLGKYTKCTLGVPNKQISNQLVTSSQIASGSISGTKLALGSIGAGQLQPGSVSALQIQAAAINSAHIQTAAIESAHIVDGSITNAKIADGTITNAKIGTAAIGTANIADGSIKSAKIDAAAITSEKVQDSAITSAKINDAAITSAKIADAAITDAHIADASISAAKIKDLHAEVAVIANAAISQAQISAAQISDLSAQVADLVVASIGTADIDWASIAELTTAISNIVAARIESADIGFAQVKDLVTGQAIITEGEAGKLFISRLAVDAMQVVSAVTNELMVKGTDGKYYRLVIENGAVTAKPEALDGSQLADRSVNGSSIVENSITASELNATSIFADEAIIRALSAGVASFGEIFAQSGIVPYLETSIVEGEGALKLAVDNAQNTADNADNKADAVILLTNDLSAEISSKVSRSELSETDNAIREDLQTAITQSADNVSVNFTKQLTDTEGRISASVSTMIRESEHGIEIGKTDSQFKTLLDNEKLAFRQADTDVAYISREQLYILAAQVLNELSVGAQDGSRFYWKKTNQGIEFKYANS